MAQRRKPQKTCESQGPPPVSEPVGHSQSHSWVGPLCDAALLGIATLHLLATPFTKVEESFNVQAAHDLLFHRTDIAAYDHHEFPGVVPRTCLGALAMAVLAAPFSAIASTLGTSKVASLLLVRFMLAAMVTAGFSAFRKAVTQCLGHHVAVALTVLTCIQFHFPFYISRPLPNTFALALTLYAYSKWLRGEDRSCLAVLVATMTVFRSELLILAAMIALSGLARRLTQPAGTTRGIGFLEGIAVGAAAMTTALVLTVPLDSLFWQWWPPSWPEGEVLYYNTVLNKSKEWGVMPFHWYFTSALPKALLGGALLAPAGLFPWPAAFQLPSHLQKAHLRVMGIVAPVLAFVLLYSFLPHKELRFIFYAIPIFNLAAALALARGWHCLHFPPSGGSLLRHGTRLLLVTFAVLLLATAAGAAVLAYASFNNYPGGGALLRLYSLTSNEGGLVHIDVAAAQSGISRFLENSRWKYSKKEDVPVEELQKRYTHLVTEHRHVDGFTLLEAVQGFARVKVAWPSQWLEDKIYIQKRH